MTELNNMEREKFICYTYLNRLYTTTQLQKKFKIYPKEIYKVLKKNNIELRGANLPTETALKICEEYEKNKKTIKQISKELQVAESTVGKILKKHGVKTRNKMGEFKRKYELNESVLKDINTFNKAQFLGLIYSDGSLSKYNKSISIRLREDDKDYLDKWRVNFLQTTKPLSYTYTKKMVSPTSGKIYEKKFGSYILDITSTKVYKDALNIGLCPNKTKANLQMPDIPQHLKFAFVLGLFEGDGTVSFSLSNKSRYFSIACQEAMGLDVKDYFDSIGIFSFFSKRKFICTVTVSRKEDLKRLYTLLYENATLFMKRKKEKFKQILEAF